MTDETARWQTDPNLSRSARIDLACDDFETAWKQDHHPSIEGYLVQLPAEQRDTVFLELLTVELSYRQKTGDPPTPSEYHVRFPDYIAQIDELFKKIVTPARLGDYELLDELGKGGMGVVHKARHRMLDRIVAV